LILGEVDWDISLCVLFDMLRHNSKSSEKIRFHYNRREFSTKGEKMGEKERK
jgi:hypothetical protein